MNFLLFIQNMRDIKKTSEWKIVSLNKVYKFSIQYQSVMF